MKSLKRIAPLHRRQQKGAVLIVALVLLVILTLFGVSTMNTTQLEERMATNSQELSRAFHSAENGLSEAFNDQSNTVWNTTAGQDGTVVLQETQDYAGSQSSFGYGSRFLGFTPVPRGTLWGLKFGAAHFDIEAQGETQAGLAVTVHGGVYQIVPSQ